MPPQAVRRALVPLAFVALLTAGVPARSAEPRRMSKAVFEDKVRGGWAGQMIGVSYGAPTEFRSNGKIIEGNLHGYLDWTPARLENAINQDDLYVEMTFAEVMDTIGLDATTAQYGAMFKDSSYELWHANAGARRLLNHGLSSPASGHPASNAHADDIDFQIESDFIGLMTPGLPREANKYADRVGRVMNWGDGLYGGMFFSGMYAAAFFESDPRKVVEQGLRSIPKQSAYARVIQDALAWSAQHPDDWTKAWRLLTDRWDKDDVCPDGALNPFNIDAKLNGAFVALGLLYGRGDFAKTLEVSTRAGQDSDCNPSSAAGILGVMLGYERIPEVWRSGIPALADREFAFTKYSFNEIVASTLTRAYRVIEGAGGSASGDEIVVPRQQPEAPALEQWRAGVPVKLIAHGDSAWAFEGEWTASEKARHADRAGAAATVTFRGTGIALVGHARPDGGRADVYLDGKRAGEIDAWISKGTNDNDAWHRMDLPDGPHTVRIVVRADADARSSGTRIRLDRAVIYGRAAR